VREKSAFLVATLALASVPNGSSVRAAEASGVSCTLRVSEQALDGALSEIARQCGIQLVYFSSLTQGKTGSAVEGSFSVEAALQKVLAGTGLAFRQINANTIEIRTAPAVATADNPSSNASRLDTRRNLSERQSSIGFPEVVIRSKIEGLVATRTETPLREIPQSVSVVSSEQIRQQNDTSLADVLTNAVGITSVQFDSANQAFFSRGFPITTYHLDGGTALHTYSYDLNLERGILFVTPDISEFDRIEVLRGSDALFGAGGNPGATVNLVRKRPLRSFAAAFNSTVGSWNNFRAEADVTGPLAFGGDLRGRLDAAYSHRDYFFDGASLARKNLFGALEYDLTARTVLTVGGSYTQAHSHPFEGGLPLFPDGSNPHLPRRTGYTFDWGRLDTQMREGYLRFEQEIASEWRLLMNATALNGSSRYNLGQFQSAVDPVTGGLPVAPQGLYTPKPALERQLSAEATVTGSAYWLGMHEQMALGADFAHFYSDQSVVRVLSFGSPVESAFHYSPLGYPDPRTLGGFTFVARSRDSSVQSGYFGSLRIERPPWAVTLGLRVSNDGETNSDSVIVLGQEFSFNPPQTYSNNGKVTPYIGAMLALDEHISLYASYSDIYQSSPGTRLPDGSAVHPADGINIEGGVKGEWDGGALNGTFAVYKIVQRGLPGYDFNTPPTFAGCCYLPNGRSKAQGVDLELNGRVVPGWLISAGYTFNNNVSEVPGYFPGLQRSQTPRHLLKVWTSRQLPGALRDWSIGATLEARSSAFASGLFCDPNNCSTGYRDFKDVQRTFAVLSPRIGYQINANWGAALTVNNLFDRVYYQTIGSPLGGSWYGEPRNFLLRIDGKL
jgi:TonB-dependent siderophore receptor